MKRTVHTLNQCSLKTASTVHAKGIGGAIHITFHTPEIVHISYHFDEVTINSIFEQASKYITGNVTTLSNNEHVEIEDGDFAYTITCAQTKVLLEKKYATVSVLYNGILQHGGCLGTSDTVLPSNQLRCFTKKDSLDSFGRFNFPLEDEDEFYGLGDKSGTPDRKGRRFSMYNRDSLGYDASLSDPLYKSVPFFIKRNRKIGSLCGLLFNQSSIRMFDLGRESPFSYSVEIDGGPYGYYITLGEHYKKILFNYYSVVGFPSFPPLFSFGFFGSSMNYVEPDDAEQRILAYFDTVESHDIPCEGMYVSSGYLKSPEGKRYAFLWNKDKFPNHHTFLTNLSNRGYNLCMNIKPGILTSHPWYRELKEKGYFIKDSNGKPYQEFFWGGDASFIDFNNHAAKEWWKSQLKEQYLDHGCTGIWNDNNELELEDIELEAYKTKTLYPIKMSEASYEVFKEQNPSKRPWIYSRSGYAGLQRFARTWSGDNVSDWKTLKYNQYMGIGMGLSGMPYFGHDLGGFFGDFPEEELLIRSCQSAVFQGRFVIHSWREDGQPTEPWSYPTALPHIRSLILEHYRFIPYIYTCAYHAATEGVPLERSLSFEFPEDSEVTSNDVNSMFGPSILKVLIVDKGQEKAQVYLPKGQWWYDKEGKVYEGGSSLTVSYPPNGEAQYFVKEGSVIPTAINPTNLQSALFNEIELLIHPVISKDKIYESSFFEDDGQTELSEHSFNLWKFIVRDSEIEIIKVSGGASKSRLFTFKTPPNYSLSQTILAPDTIKTGESIIISINR